MMRYETILVAVELIKETDAELLNHVERMAKELGSNVTLVHAVEHIGSYGAYGVGAGFEIEKILIDSASKEMGLLGERVGIPANKQVVKIGSAKFVILEEAERIKADLIIVGSHGRHGIRALLGSTANGVLHGATCDVLAVRLKTGS